MIQQITNSEVDAIIGAMTERGRAIAGCDLGRFHEVYSPAKEKELKAAIVPFVYELYKYVAGDEDSMQTMPNLRVHRPGQNTTVPFHSDTLYGHSHLEVNYWLALTKAEGSNSLWMVPDKYTGELHERLRAGMSLDEFNRHSQSLAEPIEAAAPGLFTFCCSQIHGSVLNTTPATRMSLDFRKLPRGVSPSVKKYGYFKPKWLPDLPCTLPCGTVATTVATLDLPVPVYLQRSLINKFYRQEGQRELVEFHGMNHAPTLEDAMRRGPVVAYSIKQVKRPMRLEHPIGFADENVWFSRESQWVFDKFLNSV